MHVAVEPGKYLVAVSGGVDSVVLLDLVTRLPGLELAVGHFDHGIRSDSVLDRQLVASLAQRYNLPFYYGEGRLGKETSEAMARDARYTFLHTLRSITGARAIMTAHHRDDVLETAVLNMVRGTGRKGLASLADTPYVLRPLLAIPKREILSYATNHGLQWHEDSTNTDERYLRNYIRRRLIPRLGEAGQARLLRHIRRGYDLNQAIDQSLGELFAGQPLAPGALGRKEFIAMPHAVAKEVIAYWLRSNDIRAFDTKTLERLLVAGKTLREGSIVPVSGSVNMAVQKDILALVVQER